MFAASKTATVSGGPPDAQFNYVTMLLHGDGTNGAQNNTFLDSSTNNFTITRNGNTTQGSFSPYGSNWSNYFNGTNSYITAPSNAGFGFGTGDFTIEFWVYYPTLSNTNGKMVIDSRPDLTNGAYWNFGITNSGIMVLNTGSGGTIVTDTVARPNQWVHYAASRSGTSLKLFANGTQVASSTDSSNTITSGVRIGQNAFFAYASDTYWDGYVSNIRVVKGTAVYTSNFTPSTTPLTAISGTQLLTCQSNRFIDNSSNALAITATGSPSVQRFNPFGTSTAYSTSVIGGSGYFPAANTGLLVNSASSMSFTGDFTIEGWFYKSTNNVGMCITGQFYSGNVQMQFDENNTAGLAGIYNGAWNTVQCTSSPINQWFHLAFSRSGTNVRVYLNGVYQGATTISGTLNFSASTGCGIGAMANYWLGGWIGYISDFRASNTARYTTTSSFTLPTAPYVSDASTTVLASMSNGAIYDNAMMNDLETVSHAQISTSVKKYGTGSIYFDGNADCLVSPYNASQEFGSGNLTWEMWINTTNSLQYSTLYSKTPASFASGMWSLMMNMASSTTGDVGVYMADYSTSTPLLQTTGVSVRDGAWHHIAVVRNGSSWVLYVDGISRATQTWSGTIATLSTSGTSIGKDQFYGRDYNGYIDDLRITKGYARYTTTFTPPTAAFSDIGPY